MFVEPFPDAFDFREVLRANLLSKEFFKVPGAFLIAHSMLPDVGENKMYLRLQVAAFQDFPLVFIEPDPAALAATVQGKVQ
ncbi:MAG: hypothetical protein JWQ04_757 [Pedosphaera sp.]|nr:hypothetical protein [Pedosphaera sp.]